jgi:hypothetical protein
MFDINAHLMNTMKAPKRNLFQKVMDKIRNYFGKRAFKAKAAAIRKSKEELWKKRAQLANSMEHQADRAIAESVQLEKINPVESKRLYDVAVELTTEASRIRNM